MACYPLLRNRKDAMVLEPKHSGNTENYVRENNELYLTSEGQDRYRLHASHAHTMRDYLAYEVHCPQCSALMTASDAPLNHLDLGQYICKSCRNIKGGK